MEENIKHYEADVLKETVEILKYFDNDFLSKIPQNFLQSMKNASQNSNKEVKIDKTKKLEQQDVSEECKDMISLIYYYYVATKERREELNQIWTQNEEAYQKELKEKYSYENLFENRKKENIKENVQIAVIEEKSMLKKIIEYIKSLFKK